MTDVADWSSGYVLQVSVVHYPGSGYKMWHYLLKPISCHFWDCEANLYLRLRLHTVELNYHTSSSTSSFPFLNIFINTVISLHPIC